jgi:hypothetical protein
MNRFKQSFSRFMYGRYGMDQLSRCLSYVVLVLIILTFFLRSNVIYTVALLGIVYIYFRMFSRNISRRSAENQKYMKIHYKFMSKFNKIRARIKDSKTHRIFKCPSCGQKIRVPMLETILGIFNALIVLNALSLLPTLNVIIAP